MSARSSPEARTRSTERRAAASATWKSPWMSTTSRVGVRLRMRELATRTRVHVWKTFASKAASVERIEQANSFQGTGSCSQTRKRRERLPATPTALFNASEKNHGRERQRNGRSRKQSEALAFVPLRLGRVVSHAGRRYESCMRTCWWFGAKALAFVRRADDEAARVLLIVLPGNFGTTHSISLLCTGITVASRIVEKRSVDKCKNG